MNGKVELTKILRGSMTKTAILIPCYNEELTIGKVIDDFSREMPGADIYVYDNNSTDRTAEIAIAHGALVRKEPRQGKGNVVRSMFRDIDADCYVMADGDDTYPASFGPVLEKLVLEGSADMAVGDRLSSTYFRENKRLFHSSGNVLVRRLINTLFGAQMHDIMSGARAFSRDFVKMFAVLSQGFEIEAEMTVFALEHNFKVVETPIAYNDRPAGSSSKLNTYSDGAKVLVTIARLFRDVRPLAFFSAIALVVLIAAGIVFVPILTDYLATGSVSRYPTLIVLGSAVVIACVCFFAGVVLSAIKRKQLESFEREYNLMRMIRPLDAAGESRER